jgi:hypothetical protein
MQFSRFGRIVEATLLSSNNREPLPEPSTEEKIKSDGSPGAIALNKAP